MPIHEDLIRFGASTFEDAGYTEASALLKMPAPPTAIVIGADLMVPGVYQAARERRRRIPGQLALVGFDEPGFADRYDPPLTAPTTTDYDLGRTSAKLLLQLLSGERTTPTEIVLEPDLKVRGSSTAKKPLLMSVPAPTARASATTPDPIARLRNRP